MTDQKILRVGVLNPPSQIDPLAAHDAETNLVLRQISEAPYTTAMGSTEIAPLLVKEAEIEPAGGDSALRFKVRGDAVFSDGQPLTTRDVHDSLRRAPALRRQCEVRLDGDWIEVSARHDDRRIDLALAHTQCSVIRGRGDSAVGTGPWMLDRSSPLERLRLVRNPYFRTPPPIDEILFQTYPLDDDGRATALVKALDAGEVDLSFVVPRDDMPALTGVRKWVSPSLGTGALFFNAARPGLEDARVRRALAHGIDRYEIAKTCYGNALAFMAPSLLPRPLGEGEEDGLGYDPSAVGSMRGDIGAGWPKSLSLLMVWGPRPYLPRPRAVAELIAAQLGALDVTVTIHEPATSQAFFEEVTSGRHDLILAGWLADYADPCDFLEALLASDRVTRMEDLVLNANHGNLRSQAMDRALANFRQRRDREALLRVTEQMDEDAPLVPLMYGSATTVASFRVRGIKATPLPLFPMTALDLVP